MFLHTKPKDTHSNHHICYFSLQCLWQLVRQQCKGSMLGYWACGCCCITNLLQRLKCSNGSPLPSITSFSHFHLATTAVPWKERGQWEECAKMKQKKDYLGLKKSIWQRNLARADTVSQRWKHYVWDLWCTDSNGGMILIRKTHL